jgi:hypothetical protein
MNDAFIKVLVVLIFLAGVICVEAQSVTSTKDQSCLSPFPAAKFFIESQPNSPLLIRDLSAELVQNPNDVMGYKRIRVTFYFENRSDKKITDYIWDDPSPDESEMPSGGINSEGLLPGESHRNMNIFHTQQGPSVVFRVSEVTFADGTKWKVPKYNRTKALQNKPVCVTPEKWPNVQQKRTLLAEGWSTPIFSDRITRTINAEPQVIDGVNVQSKLYEIKRERLDTVQGCAPDAMFERFIGNDRDFDFDVEKYRSFSIKKKIFAYLINYEYIDESGQYEIGAGSSSFYVDKNGNGKFTLQCGDSNVTPTIPSGRRNLTCLNSLR